VIALYAAKTVEGGQHASIRPTLTVVEARMRGASTALST
jgi:hypothetical protein